MKKETKIILAAAGIAAVTGAVTATVLSAVKVLSDTAIKKDVPKVMKPFKVKISGSSAPDKMLMDAANRKADELKERADEKVTIKNRDDIKLTGHILRHPEPERIIIAMHGWRSHWSFDFSLIAPFLYDEKSTILFPDQRAHGESEGDHIGFGVFERNDCIDWLGYALENAPEDIPIYLCGVSMGATTVLMASELDLPDRVKGIISDCGFTSPKDIWQHVMNENLKIKSKLALNIADFYISREAKMDTKTVSTVTAVSNTKTPILFVHGDADSFVPVDMTYRNYEACASEKQLLIVPGADHGLSYFNDAPTYKQVVREFFKKYDK
ncbi:MAG: alpha/beta hydrolase [Clostridia bacterium]|nr:alpha/beta hydrolase [Clostridia bacterium]